MLEIALQQQQKVDRMYIRVGGKTRGRLGALLSPRRIRFLAECLYEYGANSLRRMPMGAMESKHLASHPGDARSLLPVDSA
jgi:hypothetical protein